MHRGQEVYEHLPFVHIVSILFRLHDHILVSNGRSILKLCGFPHPLKQSAPCAGTLTEDLPVNKLSEYQRTYFYNQQPSVFKLIPST